MSDKDESYLDAATRIWNDTKKEHPKATAVAGMVPVLGMATGALDLNDAHNRSDKGDMALAAAGMVPSVKLISTGAKALRAGNAAKGAVQAAIGAGTAVAGPAANAKVEHWPEGDNGRTGADDYAEEWNK